MPTTCAICIAINRNLTGALLPTVVTYRGFSVCIDHLQLWEVNREAEWEEMVELAWLSEPRNQLDWSVPEGDFVPKWVAEKMADIEDLEEAEFGGSLREIEVVKVDLPDDATDEEKLELLDEAVKEFQSLSKPGKIIVEEKKEELKSRRRRKPKTYFCTKCQQKHSRKSNIGKKHEGYAE